MIACCLAMLFFLTHGQKLTWTEFDEDFISAREYTIGRVHCGINAWRNSKNMIEEGYIVDNF